MSVLFLVVGFTAAIVLVAVDAARSVAPNPQLVRSRRR